MAAPCKTYRIYPCKKNTHIYKTCDCKELLPDFNTWRQHIPESERWGFGMATPYGFMVLPLFMASQHVYGVTPTRYQRKANASTLQRHRLYTATPLRLRRKGDMKVLFFIIPQYTNQAQTFINQRITKSPQEWPRIGQRARVFKTSDSQRAVCNEFS